MAGMIGVSLVFYFFTKVNSPGSADGTEVSFQVEKGESAKKVADSLAGKKLINSPYIFGFYVYSKGASEKIQAGEYLLNRKMSVAEIVDVLTEGKVVPNERKITIIEGWSNRQIGERLGEEGLTEFLVGKNFAFRYTDIAKPFAYQGFLFPDTYVIGKNATSEDLIEKMLANFELKTEGFAVSGEAVILASIIEKEVGRNKEWLTDEDRIAMQKERRLVASVFSNRLQIGMPLQSDATVNYVTDKNDRQALLADTKIKSPYNTYVNKGLPPTPISNPGLDSIKAALEPSESDYLYFLNAPDGAAYFARTIEEHNANRAKYLQ